MNNSCFRFLFFYCIFNIVRIVFVNCEDAYFNEAFKTNSFDIQNNE